MHTIQEVAMGEFIIECQRCADGDDAHRQDCLVAFLVDAPATPIGFDDQEEQALRALRQGGLLPPDVRIGPDDDLRKTAS